MEIIERFWRHVQRCEHGVDCAACCWLWTASYTRDGYGQFMLHTAYKRPDGKVRRLSTHRLSWMLTAGDIPEGLCVLHNCPGKDNRLCVNPAHLWLGTIMDNTHDAMQKGAFPFGDRNGLRRHPEAVLRGADKGNAVLHDEQVLDIRYLAGQGMPHKLLGMIYGIHRVHVGKIAQGKIWRHLPIIVEVR